MSERAPIFLLEGLKPQLLEYITSDPYPVVLVDGPSGAGKNTYADRLASQITYMTGKEPLVWETDYSQYDRATRKTFEQPKLSDMFRWGHLMESIETILDSQRLQEPAPLSHIYRREAGGIIDTSTRPVNPNELLILCGVYAASGPVLDELRRNDKQSISILVDSDPTVRLLRTQERARITGARTPEEQMREMEWFNHEYGQYQEDIRHRVDMVVKAEKGMFIT